MAEEELKKIHELLIEGTKGLRCSLGWWGLDTNLELAKAYMDDDMFDIAKDIVVGQKEGIDAIGEVCEVSLESAKTVLDKAIRLMDKKEGVKAKWAIQGARAELGKNISKSRVLRE